MKMEANEMLYGHGVVTCEWNCGDKGESGWYFEYILETLQAIYKRPVNLIWSLIHLLIKEVKYKKK